MSWNDHDHRGEYAEARHSHFGEYAEERHYHHDLEHADESAQREIRGLREDISELRRQLDDALDRIADLEKQTPQARQLQLEADLAMADAAAAGYGPDDYGPPVGADRHGLECQCPYCATDDEPGMVTGTDVRIGYQDDEPDDGPCIETSDGQHTASYYDGDRCGACGLFGPQPDDEPEEEPPAEEYDPGPEIDDEGGMSEYRYILPEDYQRGQS